MAKVIGRKSQKPVPGGRDVPGAKRDYWKLLIADDDQGCRESLVEYFSLQGFEVSHAQCGTQAIEILMSRVVDFSVMDLHMPGLSGIQVLNQLRDEGLVLPCIVVSAHASKEDKIRAIDAGAFSLLHKPIDLALLRYSVEKLLRRFYPGIQPPAPQPEPGPGRSPGSSPGIPY